VPARRLTHDARHGDARQFRHDRRLPERPRRGHACPPFLGRQWTPGRLRRSMHTRGPLTADSIVSKLEHEFGRRRCAWPWDGRRTRTGREVGGRETQEVDEGLKEILV